VTSTGVAISLFKGKNEWTEIANKKSKISLLATEPFISYKDMNYMIELA